MQIPTAPPDPCEPDVGGVSVAPSEPHVPPIRLPTNGHERELSLAGRWADPAPIAAVEALIRALCLPAPPERAVRDDERDGGLGQLVWDHVASGGKRMRARLAIFAVEALGGQAADAVPWGACCELLHNASLIHDDIQDGDRYRRGRPALWTRHGIPQAINAGDLSITLAYLAIGHVPVSDALRWRLTQTVSTAARHVVLGQAAELRLLAGDCSWERYAACVEGKTSALFALPLEGAALIAGRSPGDAAELADVFRPLGLLFQIQDDILDLYGENGREMRGSDLAQSGKVTAIVVEHLRLHPEEREWLLEVLRAPRDNTPPAEIERAIERFVSGGAVAAVWRRIDALVAALEQSRALAREPALFALAETFAAEALRLVAHTRPRTTPPEPPQGAT